MFGTAPLGASLAEALGGFTVELTQAIAPVVPVLVFLDGDIRKALAPAEAGETGVAAVVCRQARPATD